MFVSDPIQLSNAAFDSAAKLFALPDGTFVLSQAGGTLLLDGDGGVADAEFDITGVFAVNAAGSTELDGYVRLLDGGFLASFRFDDGPGGAAEGVDILLQRYDALGDPVGEGYVINTSIAGDQGESGIVRIADGGALVWWRDPSAAGAVSARLLNEDGSPRGGQFELHTAVSDDIPLDVIATGDNAIFAFADRDESAPQEQLAKVGLQPLIVGKGEFLDDSDRVIETADIAALPTGDGALTWSERKDALDPNDTDLKIKYRFFDAAGYTGDEVEVVNRYTPADLAPKPVIAALADGGFAIVWVERTGEAPFAPEVVNLQIVDSSGALSGDILTVNTPTAPQAGQYAIHTPQLAVNEHGSLLITWTEEARDGATNLPNGETTRTFARAFQTELPASTATPDDDSVILSDAGEVFDALAGNDIVLGGDGDDEIEGGDGDDFLLGQGGRDILSGSAGNDRLDGGDGADILSGGDGDDQISGGDGEDQIDGGGGSDDLSGGDGVDTILGGTGDDRLDGGAAADTLDGGDGFDIATYASSGAGVTLDLAVPAAATGASVGDVFISIEAFEGSSFVDLLRGSADSDDLRGAGGDDDIQGRGGDDTIEGGAGLDRLTGGEGADSFVIRNFADIAGLGDVITDFSVGDSIVFDLGADFAATQNFIGDVSFTGTQNELRYRIDGANIVLELDRDADALANGRITLEGVAADLTAELQGQRLIVSIDTDTPPVDPPTGLDVTGGDGSDDILGTTLDDTINGALGDDTLYGLVGDDIVSGGDGDDLVRGDRGADDVSGGAGADIVRGGADDDIVSGDADDDIVSGDAGDDVVFGGDGDDIVRGGAGNDTLDGGAGADRVIGDRDDDTVLGGLGDDVVKGGLGDDFISGGEGSDILWGDGGADVFHFSANDGVDIVKDFASGEDRIDLQSFGFVSFDQVLESVSDNSLGVRLDLGDGDIVLLRGVSIQDLSSDDFLI